MSEDNQNSGEVNKDIEHPSEATHDKPPESVYIDPPQFSESPSFTRDFFTGCLSLVLVSLIVFVAIPVLLFVVKLSAAIVIPLAFLVILVILTASIGRIINVIRARWSPPSRKP